ncbi:MAG: YdcF family protein [Actinomycetota bacterium]|nr:YdcF family protein [Actinomycetota bacterium]
MALLGLFAGIRLLRFVLRIVVLVVVAAVVYVGVTAVQVWLTGRHYDPHPAQAIVVMGAAQYDGSPSPDLRARLDEALLLWRQHLAPLVAVTGSKQPGDQYTEAQAGATYLELHGVPAADVLEAGGRDSWSNLADAAPLLTARHATDVLLVTDPFHEDRSLAIATDVGLHASPTPTQTSPIRGWSVVPYYAKEAVGVALGRIIGFDHLTAIRRDLG